MLQDPSAFMNPEGVSNPRGEGVLSGLAGLGAWAGGSLIERHLLKSVYNKEAFLGATKGLKESSQMRMFRSRAKILRTHPSMKSFPGIVEHRRFERATNVAGRLRRAALSKTNLSTELNIVTARSEIGRMKTYNKFARTEGRFFKGISTAIGVSMAFSLGEQLFTPSVNKLAADADAAVFYDESILDSGAAFTQRQRAIMAIMDSNMAVQNVVGNEASHFHR